MKLTHADLQGLLDKYPDFKWVGDLGRRLAGQERFTLGAAKQLGLAGADAEPFEIRAFPARLADRLRTHLLIAIGEAVVHETNAPTKDMTADVLWLEE